MVKNNWKVHPIHDDILVSDNGTILRRKRGHWHELNQYPNSRGYMRIGVAPGTVPQCVHTLVAETFVENPDPSTKKIVNHIDGNKRNNCANNLEWVTSSENQKHAYQRGLRTPNYAQKKNRPVMIVETKESFRSINECARHINGNPAHILECLNGARNMHRDCHFRFADGGGDE